MYVLFLSVMLTAVLAQAPWPHPDGSASHSRAVHPAWPRNATLLQQLSAVPFCSPVLIGANGTLFGAASDGLLRAFAPSGRELWALAVGSQDICALELALSDSGSFLLAYQPATEAAAAPAPIAVVALGSVSPSLSFFSVNGTVVQATVSGERIVALVGFPDKPPYMAYFSALTLCSYSPQGQLQWNSDYVFPPSVAIVVNVGSALAVRGEAFFNSVCSIGIDFSGVQVYFTSLGAYSLLSGEVHWRYYSQPSRNALPYIGLLAAPSDSALLSVDTSLLMMSLAPTTGNYWWPSFMPVSSETAFAASAAGDFLALFSARVETLTGNTSRLPVPPMPCTGTVLLDSSGALFCVADKPPDTLLLAFDISTGSELLSVDIPFPWASVAFSASGQLFVSCGAGLFTLQPPQPSPSSDPPPPAPTTQHSALPAIAWGALGGACAGAAAALGVVVGVPRLRAWLALQQPVPPQGDDSASPAFAAAGDYARLN
jgi:hypothetical protein